MCDHFLQGSGWRLRWSWPIWTSTTSCCWPGPSSTWWTPSKVHFLGLHVTTCGTPVRAQAPARFGLVREVCYKFSPPPSPRIVPRWHQHLGQPSSVSAKLQLVLSEQHHHRKFNWKAHLFVSRNIWETMLTNILLFLASTAQLQGTPVLLCLQPRHSTPLIIWN